MPTLILGASGVLGRALLAGFRAHGDTVVGTCYTRTTPELTTLDVQQPDATTALLHHTGADVVINAIGERRPEIWRDFPDTMRALNTDAAATIARAATAAGAWLLHISSDYVFHGGNPPYTPTDQPDPVNPYGQSKLDAEHLVRLHAPDAAILRVPLLFGPTDNAEETNVTHLAALVASGIHRQLDHTVRRYPTHVDDVTTICRRLTAHTRAGHRPSGIWHYSNPVGTTKYELAQLIADVHNQSATHLRPDHTPLTDRPGDCRLDTTDLAALLGEIPAPTATTFAARVRTVTRPWINAPHL